VTTGLATAAVANGLLNALRAGGTTLTVVAGTYVKLHVGDPGAAGANNPAAGSTTRVAVTQAAAAGGSIVMNGTPPAWTNAGTSETLTHISVWDAASAGNFLYSAVLATPATWVSGNISTLGSLGVTIAPLAV
jgi:hypothetical protein